jgi:hypothetical protein
LYEVSIFIAARVIRKRAEDDAAEAADEADEADEANEASEATRNSETT